MAEQNGGRLPPFCGYYPNAAVYYVAKCVNIRW